MVNIRFYLTIASLMILTACPDTGNETPVPSPSPTEDPNLTAPHLELSATSVHFGGITLGLTGQETLTLGNSGDATLSVSYTLSPADGPFTVEGVDGQSPPTVVDMGASSQLKLRFVPDQIGEAQATLTLSTNDEDRSEVEILLSGTGLEVDEDQDGSPESEDCDDTDSSVYPDALEVCDEKDNDCDGETDEGVLTVYYEDEDGDGHGSSATALEACSAKDGQVSTGDDCNDTEAIIFPGAVEACDGLDNDCDLEVDEDVLSTFYRDQDEDGAGNASDSATGCTAPEGYVADPTDCDDENPAVFPNALESCDELDNDCDGKVDEEVTTAFFLDADSDDHGNAAQQTEACSAPEGYVLSSDDCLDTSSSVWPGHPEECDGLDNDCDGTADEGTLSTYFFDGDSDAFGLNGATAFACSAPDGYTSIAGDCDDEDASVYPDALEACDGKDNDCDTAIDEEGETPFYFDADGDGFGDSLIEVVGCDPDEGYVSDASDCNDRAASVYPGAAETCNQKDDDCDGSVDEDAKTAWYLDADRDGFGDLEPVYACTAPDSRYQEQTGDCNDLVASIYPGALEVCNNLDDDCDTEVDEGDLKTVYYEDSDGDGFGDESAPLLACSRPEGASSNHEDCDDTDALTHPGAIEACDQADNDCDGTVDEGVKSVYYQDNDEDGYGVTGATLQDCSQPAGYTSTKGDCNDQDETIFPGAAEVCNGADDDCDGLSDEDGDTVFYLDADHDGYGDALVTTTACYAPSSYVETPGDCNDRSATTYPGALESCNGVDDDCDSSKDEEVTTPYYLDADRDGYGDGDASLEACSPPASFYVLVLGDCDDLDAEVHPGATETCNGTDDDCSGTLDEGFDADQDGTSDCVDDDGDGFTEAMGDCDDQEGQAYPGALEVRGDGIDNDCDGREESQRVINFDTWPDGSAAANGTALLDQYASWGVYFRTDGTTTTAPTIRSSGYGFSQATSGTNGLGSDSYNSAGLVAYFAPDLYVTKVSIRDLDDDCTYKILYAFDAYGNILDQMRSDGQCHTGGARPTLVVDPVDSQGEPIPIARVEFDTVAGPSGGSLDGTYFTIDDFTFVYSDRLPSDARTRMVDFEVTPEGSTLAANVSLTTQYQGWGVTFSTDGTTSSPPTIRSSSGTGFLRPASVKNVLGSDSYNSAGLVATFDSALFVYRVSLRDTDDDGTVKTLYAFGANGQVIATDQSNGTSDSGAPLPLIQVAPVDSSGQPLRIYKVEFDTQAGASGGSYDGTYFTLDDFSFTWTSIQ